MMWKCRKMWIQWGSVLWHETQTYSRSVQSINIKIIWVWTYVWHSAWKYRWSTLRRGLYSRHATAPLSLSWRMLLLSLICTLLRACSYGQLIAGFGAWLWREPAEVKAFIPRSHVLPVTGSWLIKLHGRSVLFPRQYWDTEDKSKGLTFYFSVTAVNPS